MAEVESVALLLERFPESGPVEVRRSGREVRRLILHKLPFVAWYHWRERVRQVVVLRLFHVRQRR
jgi:plasmid stabilization system protein ParE